MLPGCCYIRQFHPLQVLTFAEALCNQSRYVFFFGYTIPLCIQKLLCGLPLYLDKYEDMLPRSLRKRVPFIPLTFRQAFSTTFTASSAVIDVP